MLKKWFLYFLPPNYLSRYALFVFFLPFVFSSCMIFEERSDFELRPIFYTQEFEITPQMATPTLENKITIPFEYSFYHFFEENVITLSQVDILEIDSVVFHSSQTTIEFLKKIELNLLYGNQKKIALATHTLFSPTPQRINIEAVEEKTMREISQFNNLQMECVISFSQYLFPITSSKIEFYSTIKGKIK